MNAPTRCRLPDRIDVGDLLLRRWLVADAEVLSHAVAGSDAHLRPWMPWMSDEPLPLSKRREMLERWQSDWEGGGDSVFGAFVGEEVAGSFGLHRRRGPQALEIGYWVAERFARRGIGTRAAALLTDAAFSMPETEWVEIRHDKANVASAGIPRRLGYRLTAEAPEEPNAPAEVGTACVWRMERGDWGSGRSGSQGREDAKMAKDHGPSVKDDALYEKLREEGESKEKAARIANAKAAGENVGKKGGEAEDYEDRTVDELRERAAEIGIEGRSDMDKDDLIDALRNH
jgi:ribosomal-protein-serine acetyltransferase